jgi:hypothetical protein
MEAFVGRLVLGREEDEIVEREEREFVEVTDDEGEGDGDGDGSGSESDSHVSSYDSYGRVKVRDNDNNNNNNNDKAKEKKVKIVEKVNSVRKVVKRYSFQLQSALSDVIVSKVGVIMNKIKCNVTIKMDSNNSDVKIIVNKYNNACVNDSCNIVVKKCELELLMVNNHNTFVRMYTKFNTLQIICSWLTNKITVVSDWKCDRLVCEFDRSVPLNRAFLDRIRCDDDDVCCYQQDYSIIIENKYDTLTLTNNEIKCFGGTNITKSSSSTTTPSYINPFDKVCSLITYADNKWAMNRTIYTETNTIGGLLCTITVQLRTDQFIFTTTTLDGVQSTVPLILSIDECKLILSNEIKSCYNDIYDKQVKQLDEITSNPTKWREMVQEVIQHLIIVRPEVKETLKATEEELENGVDDLLSEIVAKNTPEDNDDGNTIATDALPLLQSPLYTTKKTLKLVLNNTSIVIGSIEITNHTTLSELRNYIDKYVNEGDVPDGYRFYYKNAPCGKKQEKSRYANELMPVASLKCKDMPDRIKRLVAQDIEKKVKLK